MATLKLVTLDITGTILKLKKPVGDIYSAAGKTFGVDADPSMLTPCFIKKFDFLSIKHPNFGLTTGLGWERWWKCLVAATFKCALNIPKECDDIDETLNLVGCHLVDKFATREGWKHAEGSVDFLSVMKSKDICIGAISNFDPRLHTILEDMGIKHFFSFVITSYESGVLKPDVNIFKKAEVEFEKITGNKFQGCNSLHIGDSMKRDYFGAKNAGWEAVLITNSSAGATLKSSEESLMFSNLSESKEYILKNIST